MPAHYAVPCRDAEVLVDPEDLETLAGVLAEGWRLELIRNHRRNARTPTLVLRGFGSIALARAVMGATERLHVIHLGAADPLDCRKAHMELRDAGRRIGWASKVNGSGSRVAYG